LAVRPSPEAKAAPAKLDHLSVQSIQGD